MYKILILGSTGSIGAQTLDVIAKHKDKFQIAGLVCHKNEKLLKAQAKKYKVQQTRICLTSKDPQKMYELIKAKDVDIVVNAISGSAGLKPAIAALKARKILALANKESIVLDGAKLKEIESANAKKGAKILPLDSEHHAVLRLLETRGLEKFNAKKVKKITLTASGGPFFGYTKKRLKKATLKDSMKHPNWKMGPKITIESATLLNKGYELIEAHCLFSAPLKNLDAIIDRKSFVHAIVEFKAPKETLALAYKPDMKVVIEDTLLKLYHEKLNKKFINKKLKILTTEDLKKYKFNAINHETFPAIKETIKAFKENKIKEFYAEKEREIEGFIKGGSTFSRLVLDRTQNRHRINFLKG